MSEKKDDAQVGDAGGDAQEQTGNQDPAGNEQPNDPTPNTDVNQEPEQEPDPELPPKGSIEESAELNAVRQLCDRILSITQVKGWGFVNSLNDFVKTYE